jgi:hypothetical protein
MASQGVLGRLHNLPAVSQASPRVRLGVANIGFFVGHDLPSVRPRVGRDWIVRDRDPVGGGRLGQTIPKRVCLFV